MTKEIIEFKNDKDFKLFPTALFINSNTIYEKWEEYGEFLGKVNGACQWWWGDWLRFGETTYSEDQKYAQGLNVKYSIQGLTDMAYVAENIDFSRRRENVSFSHHRDSVPLYKKCKEDNNFKPYEDLMDKIESDNLTLRELRQEIKKLNAPKRKIKGKAKIEIFCDDFRNNDIADETIDLILTDPPYPKEFRSLWEDLAKEAKRVLKPGGFMIAYSGQNGLPEIIKMLEKHLDYYWLGNLYHRGGVAQRFEVNMFNRGKPILFFYKKPLKKQEGWIDDVLISEQSDKDMHEWGQSVEPLEKIINAFTEEGDTIFDPFFGGGSVIEAAAKNKRNIIGYEIDKDYYKLVKNRTK